MFSGVDKKGENHDNDTEVEDMLEAYSLQMPVQNVTTGNATKERGKKPNLSELEREEYLRAFSY